MPAADDQDNATDPTPDPARLVARLERRLERERRARRDAEEIADRGMRELWLANQSLDARVEERTADLEATLEELRLASSARERFLATLSHEMRTPLNGVLGMIELLLPQTDHEQSKAYLRTAQESAERLNQLLARLLDLVELESGTLQPSLRNIQAEEITESIREQWQMKLLHHGQLLSTECHLEGRTLAIDDVRVNQIVDELLHNVTRHASPGAVRVELQPDRIGLLITVRDSGPGIDPDRIEDLLGDFSMLDDSAARARQGMGLGLGLCRRIAQALSGTLTLTSDGETFTQASLTVAAEVQAQPGIPQPTSV